MTTLFDPEKKLKRTVPNNDHLHFAKSLALAKIIADRDYAQEQNDQVEFTRLKNKVQSIRRSKRLWQEEAYTILNNAQLNRNQEYFDFPDYQTVADTMQNYKICIYTRVPPAKVYSLLWKGNDAGYKTINLAVFSDVYDIFKPNRTTIGKEVCDLCSETYGRRDNHFCSKMCKQCRRAGCRGVQIPPTECDDCHVLFYRQECLDAHKVIHRNSSVCTLFKRCPLPNCLAFYKPRNLRDGVHICGNTKWCSDCSSHVNVDTHNCCWIPPNDDQKGKVYEKQQKYKILIYDLETVLLEKSDDLTVFCEQYTNFIGYSMFCQDCIGTSLDHECVNCGPLRTGHFKWNRADEPRSSVVKKFLHFILYDKSLENAIVVAHNGGRFDLHFLIPSLIEWGIFPDMLKNGMKVIQMKITREDEATHNNLVFKDSFLFVPVALSAMPKAFGFPEMKKGTFPYLYNHPDRYGTISASLPPIEFYNPKDMKKAGYQELTSWHEENIENEFDFDKELLEYCMDDVRILHQGVSRYIRTSIEHTSFNPLVHSCTFASFSFFILKQKHLKPDQIAILPEHGYHSNDVQSKLAISYFKWVENDENIDLQYALKGGEKVVHIGGRRVKFDAFHAPTNTVYEVLGCWIHGCITHTQDDTEHPYYKKTMAQIRHETQERLDLITSAGYNLKIQWEHDIEAELLTNREMRKFFKDNQHYKRLRVRDSFCGGRTQNYRLYARAKPSENITLQHRDVVSMYPYLLCNNEMPLGQPEVITSDFSPITLPLPYNGFYLIDILPPRDLLHPVIPFKHDSRLIFGLCRECIYAKHDGDCPHEDEEDRYLHVTVYQAELELALRHNYKVLRVYEVYNWGSPAQWSRDFFRDFLMKFIKIKTEASGWPRENMTDQEKRTFVQEFYDHEDILVDETKMVKNPEARAIAKIIISSVWGKMAETDDKITTSFHHADSDELSKKLNDVTLETVDMQLIGDTHMISTRKKENYQKPRPFTNVAYASIVCSLGRVELYKMLERLGPLACYGDTDSGIYVIENGDDKLADMAGEFLGKWSSEVPEGYRIMDFASTGPKVYSYRLQNNEDGTIKEIVKARGISQSFSNSALVNFNSIRRLARGLVSDIEREIVTEKNEIVKTLGHVYTVRRSKKLRPVMKKVRFFPDFTTKPFGWKE